MSRACGINAEARREDLAFMAANGETATGAADRLGITLDALEKWCRTNKVAAWSTLRATERDRS